jgi:hypothetical protein
MQQQGTVVLANAATGRFALRVADGSYVLAEELSTQPLRIGDSLSGQLDTIGIETLTDTGTASHYDVFVVAYGLSHEAVEQEMA